jgi:hypothetical protein
LGRGGGLGVLLLAILDIEDVRYRGMICEREEYM